MNALKAIVKFILWPIVFVGVWVVWCEGQGYTL